MPQPHGDQICYNEVESLLIEDRDRSLRTTQAWQRIGPVAALPTVLRDFGVSAEEALEGTGIRMEALSPEVQVPFSALLNLLERASQLARCPHLGLLLGARCDHRALGAIGTMMSHAPTLGDALRDYGAVQLGYSQGATVYLQRFGTDYALGYGMYDRTSRGSQQLYDLAIAAGCNFVRSITGGRARPLRALLSRRAPPDPKIYASILRLPLAFDQEQTCLMIAGGDMELALPKADAAAYQRLREWAQHMANDKLGDIAARVRHILRPQLLFGEGSRDAVARKLGLSGRTLTRHLAAAGTSFEVIKDEVRFAVARELLLLTDLPVGQIGACLSYTTQSAFNHAFQRWAGTAPSEWRSLHAEE